MIELDQGRMRRKEKKQRRPDLCELMDGSRSGRMKLQVAPSAAAMLLQCSVCVSVDRSPGEILSW